MSSKTPYSQFFRKSKKRLKSWNLGHVNTNQICPIAPKRDIHATHFDPYETSLSASSNQDLNGLPR